MSNLPMLVIKWRDHYGSSGWKDLNEADKLLEPNYQLSVGWLVAEDAHRLVIVQTLDLDPDANQVRDSLTLEKSCIVSRANADG